MMIPDDVRGDAPVRLAIHHDRGKTLHSFALLPALVCFATSSMTAAPGARAEADDPPPSSKKPGTEPDGACKACGMQNEADAKFCDQCGASMAAARAEDDDDPPPSSEDPDSSQRDGAQPPPPKRAAAIGPDAAYAELAGVPSTSSVPAIKSGLAGRVNLALHVMSAFELSDPARATAAFDDAIQLAASVPTLEKKLAEHDERAKLNLALKIVDLRIDGYRRDDLVKDVVDDKGRRTGIKLRGEYRRMSLAEMDEKHRRLSNRAPKRRDTPFEPDPSRAKDAAAHGGLDHASRVEAAKKHPQVLALSRDPNNAHRTIDQIAAAWVRNEDAARGAAGGAP